MNSNLIIIKVLMNGVSIKPMLINTGCECYSIMNKNLIIKLQLPCVKILLKPIINFAKKILRNRKWKLQKLQNSLVIFKDTGKIYLFTWCLLY